MSTRGVSIDTLPVTGSGLGGSGSSGGGGILTHAIVVGNSVEGDTASEVDFLDVGDGVQLQAALAAAAVTAPGTQALDVYVRPGVYDLNAGAATAPLTIPAGVVVRGAGSELTRIGTKDNGDNQSAFLLPSPDSILMDVGIDVAEPTTGTATGDNYVVQIRGTGSRCIRVEININAGTWSLASAMATALRNAFAAGDLGVGAVAKNVKIIDCVVNAPSLISLGLAPGNEFNCLGVFGAPSANEMAVTMENCVCTGGDRGVYAERTVQILTNVFTFWNETGIVLASVTPPFTDPSNSIVHGNQIRGGLAFAGTERGILLGTSVEQCSVINNHIEVVGAVPSNQRAVSLEGADKNVIHGNRGPSSGTWANAVRCDASAGDNVVTSNNFGRGPTYVDLGVGNDFSHNI